MTSPAAKTSCTPITQVVVDREAAEAVALDASRRSADSRACPHTTPRSTWPASRRSTVYRALANPDHAHSESALHPVGGQRGLDHRPCRRAHVRADVRVVVDEYVASGRQPSARRRSRCRSTRHRRPRRSEVVGQSSSAVAASPRRRRCRHRIRTPRRPGMSGLTTWLPSATTRRSWLAGARRVCTMCDAGSIAVTPSVMCPTPAGSRTSFSGMRHGVRSAS